MKSRGSSAKNWILCNRLISILGVLALVAVLTAINNYYYYVSQEKVYSEILKKEIAKFRDMLRICDRLQQDCTPYIQVNMDNMALLGSVSITSNGTQLYFKDKERRKDERNSVIAEKKFSIGDKNYVVHMEKRSTPPLFISIVRSMTFSIADWPENLFDQQGNFDKDKFFYFMETFGVPRSRPAFFFLLMAGLLFGLYKSHIARLNKRWEQLDKKNQFYSEKIDAQLLELESQRSFADQLLQESEGHKIKLLETQQHLTKIQKQLAGLEAEKSRVEAQYSLSIQEALLQRSKIEEELKQQSEALKGEVADQQKMHIEARLQLQKKLKKAQDKIDSLQMAHDADKSRITSEMDALMEDQQYKDIEIEELEGQLTKFNSLISEKDNEIADLNKRLAEAEASQQDIKEQQHAIQQVQGKEFKRYASKLLLENPTLKFVPVPKISYLKNDHHHNDFVTGIFDEVCSNPELKYFVKSVHSTAFDPHYPNTLILRKGFKNSNRTADSNDFNLTIVAKGGKTAMLFLTAKSHCEAFVQAKLIKLHMRSIGTYPILEKMVE